MSASAPRSVVVQARVERGSALVHVDRSNDAELRAAVEAAEAEGEWVLVTRGLNNLFEAIPVFTPEGRVVVDRFRRAAGRAGFDSMSHAISAFREAEIASAGGDLAATRRAMERGAEWCLRCQQDAEWLMPLEFDLAFEEGRAADARTALERLALSAEPGHASWWARTELELAWLDSDPTAVHRWADRYLAAEIPDNLFVLTDVINVVDLALDGGVDARHLGDGLQAALAGHPSRGPDLDRRRGTAARRGRPAGRGRRPRSTPCWPIPTRPSSASSSATCGSGWRSAGWRRASGRGPWTRSSGRSTSCPAGRAGGGTGPLALRARLEAAVPRRRAS